MFSYDQVTSSDGIRYYNINNSLKLSSVTTIISAVKPKVDFSEWRKKVGEEGAKAPAKRGNALHSLVEFHYKGEEKVTDNVSANECFKRVKPLLSIIQPFAIEEKTHWVHDSGVGFAGTLDIGGYINGSKLIDSSGQVLSEEKMSFVGDWKTWDKPKYPIGSGNTGKYYPLISYALQLSAYCAAFNQRTELIHRINRGFIFGVTDTCRAPFIYYFNPETMGFYWSQMKEIVRCFYSKDYYDWSLFEQTAENNNYLGERVHLTL